jgi:hypothetical protein
MRARLVGVVALVVLTAGCTGVLFGDDDLAFESGETLIENETLAENGYELKQSERQTFNETISVDGAENGTRIVVTSHVARYGVESDLPSGIGTVRIGLVTTPDASVAGQSVNPLLRMDSYERAFRYLPETDQQGFETYGNYTAEPFGEPVNVTVLATETESDEETPEAFVHVMQASRPTGDAVLAYAMHTAEEADEAPKIAELFSSLEYTPPEDVSES